MAVPAWARLVLLEPPSLCRRLFDDGVAGAGLELLEELARTGFEPKSPAAGVYAHNHSSTNERCSVWLLPPLQRASLHQNSMLNAMCIEDVVYLPKAIQWNPKSNIIHHS